MEELLKKYIKRAINWYDIYDLTYDIDGAGYTVKFYTDSARMFKESMTINIWDMMIFINETK